MRRRANLVRTDRRWRTCRAPLLADRVQLRDALVRAVATAGVVCAVEFDRAATVDSHPTQAADDSRGMGMETSGGNCRSANPIAPVQLSQHAWTPQRQI